MDVAHVVGVDGGDRLGGQPVHVVVAAGDGDVSAAACQQPGVRREEVVEDDVHRRLVVPDRLEGARLEAGVEHVLEMKADPAGKAVLGRLVVGEVHLGLGDGDAVDPAAEGGAGHDAGPAPARTGVQQAVLGPDLAQMAEQEPGLGVLKPVELGDDRFVAGAVVGHVEHGPVDLADTVMVVVDPRHIAQAQVDRIAFSVPVVGDVALVDAGDGHGGSCATTTTTSAFVRLRFGGRLTGHQAP